MRVRGVVFVGTSTVERDKMRELRLPSRLPVGWDRRSDPSGSSSTTSMPRWRTFDLPALTSMA